MKRCYLILLFLGCSRLAIAQELPHLLDVTSPSKQFGVDVSGFVTRFLTFRGDEVSVEPDIFFLYRTRLKENKNTRFGFGTTIQTTKNDDFKSSFFQFNLSFGKETFTNFARRWRAYVGWEAQLNMAWGKNAITVIGGAEKSRIGRAGLAIITGVQCAINSRLSLHTEANYNLGFTFAKFDDNNSTSFLGRWNSPRFITLNYHF